MAERKKTSCDEVEPDINLIFHIEVSHLHFQGSMGLVTKDGVEAERWGTQGKTIWRNLRFRLAQFVEGISMFYGPLSESISSGFMSFELVAYLLMSYFEKTQIIRQCVSHFKVFGV